MTHRAYSKQKAVSIFSLIAWGCWDGGWASERWDKAMKLPSRQWFFFFFFPFSRLSPSNKEVKVQTWRRMKRRRHARRRAEGKRQGGEKGRNRTSFCVMLYMEYFQAASILKSSNTSLTSADMAPSSRSPTLCQPDDLLAKLSNEVVPFFLLLRETLFSPYMVTVNSLSTKVN